MNQLRWRFLVFCSRWRNRLRYLVAAPRLYRNWWAWPLPKLGVSVVLELRTGVRYFVRAGSTDLAVVNEAAALNPYLRAGHLQLREDAIVVDVGANIGDFSVQAAKLCPRGRVYAIEPITGNVRMITLNKILNGLRNVVTLHLALGDHEGEVEIRDEGVRSSTYFANAGSVAESVRITSLQKLMQEHDIEQIDLLKLDCEGAEWDIIPSSVNVLPKISQICREFHPDRGWTAERLASWLGDQGYTVRHTGGGWNGLLWATRLSPDE